MNERVILELDSDALAAARAAGIDLAELLAEALRRRLPQLDAAEREDAARKWYGENRVSVDAYNKIIDTDGFLFSDGVRTF